MARLRNGWIEGKLLGPDGRFYEVVQMPEAPVVRLQKRPPNLLLHTTETDAFPSYDYPPQFTCGKGIVGQHFPVWAKGYSVDTEDDRAMQIEQVAHSELGLWLPPKETLYPTVALVAFLHKKGLITSGLKRPEALRDLPLVLDIRPSGSTNYPATDRYYRRHLGAWPTQAGVYGHVDTPNDEHWDPGSYDYPRFFTLVRRVLLMEKFLEALLDAMRGGVEDNVRADPVKAAQRIAAAVRQVESGAPAPVIVEAPDAHADLSTKRHRHREGMTGEAIEPAE